MFPRRRAEDSRDGFPPQAQESYFAALGFLRALFTKRLFHVGFELTAEVEREQAQKRTIDPVG
jgi:hypothetical protein